MRGLIDGERVAAQRAAQRARGQRGARAPAAQVRRRPETGASLRFLIANSVPHTLTALLLQGACDLRTTGHFLWIR